MMLNGWREQLNQHEMEHSMDNIANVDSENALRADDDRWQRIQAFVQEAGIVLDYLHWRVLCKRYGEQPATALYLMSSDSDGELTKEMVVEQLEAIARQARAGFVDGPDFPVFASIDRSMEEGT